MPSASARRILLAALLLFGGAVLGGAAPVRAETLDDDLAGTANPDPDRIQGVTGDSTIAVEPRGDAEDHRNLQWAVDNVSAGGTVALGSGTFFLGDGERSPKKTVRVRRGMHLSGVRDGEEWKTVIRGGGDRGCGPALEGSIESGPFRIVNDSDPHPVVFEGIWMREWTAEAVCIDASRGFEFRDNRLSHPVNTTVEGAIKFVHALWTTGSEARGDFIVEGNLVELGGYEGPLADDEQFMGVFYSNHDTIRVVDNVITGIDEAIEIIGNRIDRSSQPGQGPPAVGPAQVIVTGNRIDVTQQPGERWPSTFAILIAGNRGTEAVHIENNDLTVRGKGYAFGISGERMTIADNRVRFEEFEGRYPAGVMTIGFGPLLGLPMGSSLTDSVFENNTFEGAVVETGIVFRAGRGDAINESTGNYFHLGDSLARLGAKTTLSISEGVCKNTFTGDLGSVKDSAPQCSNSYKAATHPPGGS